MKQRIIFIAICFLALSTLANPSSDSNSTPNNVVILHSPAQTNKPKAPSRVYIECIYGYGYLSFTLPQEVSTLNIYVYQNGNLIFSDIITDTHEFIEAPIYSGEYYICGVSNLGKTFEGSFYI